ncbi:roundabout homolog 1 [Procambarus clarkii]|uniref:roundabout homolog 1 n=1 Tax=Procambarus clarkii TaxID=6728 RepID=UPI001E674B87|nr:roundabout homolog 1-like [Procambarus clarkii]
MDAKHLVFLLAVCLAQQGEPPVIKEHPSNMVARRNDPATLNCAASGAARVRWFRDGEEVVTSTQDPRSHRVLLPSGSLFFLRVTATRKDSDTGTYWCVASNSYGTTRSHNATLTVATLAYDFQSQAEPTVKARVGDSVSLPCRPPKATPPPELTWLRDGRQVTNSSRVSVTEAGDLVISQAVQEDSAAYVCRARNAAGTRESSPTQLTIMTPPWFEERPSNVTAPSGVVVELTCRARGSPTPTVTWRRLDGKMPQGRARIENQNEQLVLEQVTPMDSGVYVCEVESEAGIASTQAMVTVVDAPQLTQRPQRLQAMAGKRVQVSCRVEGEPRPLVLWRLPTLDRTAILITGQSSGHASVSDDGQSLLLEQTAIEDSGTYYCWGVSSGGGVSGRAEVVVVSALPPPVVGIGPRDLMVAPGSIASFPCEVVSEAAEATISWWYRPAAHLPSRQLSQDPRIFLPDTGALILKNVHLDDAGIYTCRAAANTGTVEKAAVLRVEHYADAVEPLLLPAPPTKPRLMAVNQTAVQLSWLPNSQVSGESGQRYIIEYWRHGWDEWRVADAVITQESCIVSHLTPGYTYTFLVRAVSKRGASFPSPWSDPVTTRPPRDPSLTMDQVRQARRRLSRPIVTLTDATVTAPDSVLLTWDFLGPTDGSVEGVLVYSVAEVGTVQVATVLGASSSSHLLHDLRPNTPYTFFIVPFWHSVEGTPSNSYTLTTPEDVPSVAPGNVRVNVREEGSVLIRWTSVNAEEARGDLVGYQVTISHNGSQTTETVVSPWLEARGLLPGRLYTVRVAAVTGAGPGPFSDPVLLDAGPNDAHSTQRVNSDGDIGGSVLYAPPQPAWLVYLLIPLVLLVFTATLIYVRRLRRKAPPSNPPHAPALYQDPSIYPDHSINMYSERKSWRPSESDKESSLSSTRLLRPDQLPNEYAEPRVQRLSATSTEPYATTALLAPASPHLNHSAHWQCSDDSGVQVNWTAFLPPPPSYPPPPDLDLGDPTGNSNMHREQRICISSSQYDNMGKSEKYDRPCDASEHTYDVYTQMTPTNRRDGFLTFSMGQSSHKVRADCHPPPPTQPPRSNTH